VINLVDLAPQTENDCSGDIGMVEHSFKRSLQLFRIRANGLRTAITVWKCDDSIDISRQILFLKAAGNEFHGMGGAVAGGNNCYVVARTNTAILAAKTKKGPSAALGRDGAGSIGDCKMNFFEAKIMFVNMLAGCNISLCESNYFAIAPDGFSGPDRAQRYLVAGRYCVLRCNHHAPYFQVLAESKKNTSYGNVVLRVEQHHSIPLGYGGGDLKEHG